MRPTLLLAGALLAGAATAQTSIGIDPPRLVVVVSIDQFRADYLTRFAPLYLPARTGNKVGGFRYLMENGAVFADAHHNHVPTATGPGHATLMTGTGPGSNGIVGNDWYDPATIDWSDLSKTHETYCVQDPSVQAVAGGKPMSPRNLKVTTVGDELKMATNGKSRVVGIAFKDRASILMAGHAADQVVWFDSASGNWTSSTFYCPDKKLPSWAAKMNEERVIDRQLGKAWVPLLPAESYRFSRKAPAEKPAAEGVFRHELGTKPDRAYYSEFTTSGFGNDYIAETVERALNETLLGRAETTDILVINLSTNDYVGHRYGPNSPEVADVSVRTDRMLSRMFNFLNGHVRGGLKNVVIAVTADHGVVPIPEEAHEHFNITSSERQPEKPVVDAVAKALTARYGEGNWALGALPNLYLNRGLMQQKGLDPIEVEKVARDAALAAPGVAAAFTRHQIQSGETPWTRLAELAHNSFFAPLSGDVLVFEAVGTYFGGGTGTGHGSPWVYDTHVPLVLSGKGIKRGWHYDRVYTTALAPTLSLLLGIEYPSGCTGVPLAPALAR
ncbi:MAG: alkaline phosphatase family protein [Fimbriimonadaceae bacterium]|nr:alkaline phosphatase family protein [Fimbriimonadaceae bacterium]QYK55014.1 MAG: alkaline phosphatase family protein [Fimbriimonadaceae bacterium]